MKIFIIYPNQLFKDITKLKNKKVLLIEEPLFFTQYEFHIQKLVLHRASMKFYEEYLIKNGVIVEYFEDESYLGKYKNEEIFIYELFDNYLEKKIYTNFLNITTLKNPNFINPNDKNKFMHKFYINRRNELNIFMENGKPLHGKYSFDSENRKKLPKDIKVPPTLSYENKYITEAKEYCKKFKTVGVLNDDFYSPTTYDEASLQLEYFIKEKFELFGDYQDAITSDKSHHFLFHSNISSSLNIGLIDLNELIDKIINAPAPYNAKEGFIRQIIGWREFMLRIYQDSHVSLRNSNFFEFKNSMPKEILNASTGIAPLDDCVKKLKKSAYNHHIERLMILGNLFLLLEIKPNDVYEFFMRYYIDAYDWVMVGNVYGMSGFSDGGSITTKPYIASSNYIIKMSDYKKSESWCEIVDALYWRFLLVHSPKFEQNPRMKMQISLLKKMDEQKLSKHLLIANDFLRKLT
ncbi:cryptochrome/photolyase family protein [Malaciobacter pacificus]|uniref:Deoxyribodipyrimidine photolyase-related protein n=1 Tax=Malaciobacter pacificus TaxID=1080223 RepID=A0A5C2H5S7_9BACT|nr:cryptochrome/photolyase family protein [Malaciobacter pacificus]QEP34307.1 deoxyribodipyrimidine photolyase-related protein [Malaciobacter pacificus]GGD47951.1 cryptochrome/photolyase family protein [Malaciobacter pacificus]